MSDHHDTTGDQAGGGEAASSEGYVYVATNPAMPDMVKIGSTTQSDPQSRISSLFTTSVPVPFELEYAAAIADDPVKVERALHEAFQPQRLHPKREFFKVEPYQVIAILKLLDVADVTEQAKSEVEAEISQEDRDARELVRRRPTLNFDELTEMQALYIDWWAEFLPAIHDAHPGWSNSRTPSYANWMNFPSGRSDVRYGLSFAYPPGALNYSLRAEVYFDDGESVYPLLAAQRSAIESECNLALRWEPLEDARASRVAVYLDPANPADRANWPEYRAWALKTLGELRRTFAAPVKDLP